MIVQTEFLKKIKDFGLNSYEAKLWTALLSRGVSTAGELSDIANVPRSRAYDVLESLEKKGFIVMKIGKPIKYLAVPPSEVVERVKRKIQEEASRQEQTLEELQQSDILNELTLLHSQGIDLVDPADIAGAIKGRENINDHLEMLIKNAKGAIYLLTTEEGLMRKHAALRKAFKKAADRKVVIKIAAPLSTNVSRELHADLKKIAQVKGLKAPLGRFFVVDKTHVVLFPLDDGTVHASYDVAVWIQSPYLACAMTKFFDLALAN